MSYKVLFLLVLGCSFSACAPLGTQRGNGPYWESQQDQIPPEIDAECRVKSGLTADTTTSIVGGGLGGAALGAAMGAVAGAITGNPGAGAAIGAGTGALAGGTYGGIQATQEQQNAYNACVQIKTQQYFMQGMRPSRTPHQQYRRAPLSSKEQRRQQLLRELDDLDRTP